MIVADTHALLWWVISRHLLSSKAREALDSRIICVTGVSVYEIASLVHRGRVDLQTDVVTWLENVIVLPKVALLPLTMERRLHDLVKPLPCAGARTRGSPAHQLRVTPSASASTLRRENMPGV